jgi:hypothetical protein
MWTDIPGVDTAAIGSCKTLNFLVDLVNLFSGSNTTADRGLVRHYDHEEVAVSEGSHGFEGAW